MVVITIVVEMKSLPIWSCSGLYKKLMLPETHAIRFLGKVHQVQCNMLILGQHHAICSWSCPKFTITACDREHKQLNNSFIIKICVRKPAHMWGTIMQTTYTQQIVHAQCRARMLLLSYVTNGNPESLVVIARFESEDKKEYLNELSKQQFDLAATTHYTTSRSEVYCT